MRVSGFSFIRNAIKYDYPVVESVTSILPVCHEFIIAVGDSEDGTADLIRSIPSEKVKIVPTVWDPSLNKGGEILAQQTDIALSHCTGDWCFYIQADEVMHEKYLPSVKSAMERYLMDNRIQGLLFKYRHFYGSYKYYGTSRRWYRNEVRIIRNNTGISSYKDAQGFRLNGKKLTVKPVDAYIYHYGWVRPPEVMMRKTRFFYTLWNQAKLASERLGTAEKYDYGDVDELKEFKEPHPQVMQERVSSQDWDFTYNPLHKPKLSLKRRLLNAFEKMSGYRIGEYKNYTIAK